MQRQELEAFMNREADADEVAPTVFGFALGVPRWERFPKLNW
jgi:hypothetical protein